MRDSDRAIYAVAETIRSRCLLEGSSLLDGRAGVWSPAAANELMDRFVDAPDVSKEKFLPKLAGQLAGASRDAVELMADLTAIYELAPVNIGVPRKRQMVEGVLVIAESPTAVPPEVLEAFASGIANPGTWYLTRPDVQLAFLIRFARLFTTMPREEREHVVEDPWRFRDALHQIELHGGYGQRAALLNIMFPDSFEAIVSSTDKRRILDYFEDDVPEPTGDEDRDILALREALQTRSDAPVHFYRPPWNGWRTTKQTAPGWLVRGAKVNGVNLVPEWLADGFCSIAFEDIPEIKPKTSAAAISDIVGQALPDLSMPQRRATAGTLDRFLNRMKPGHVVATVQGSNVYVGTVDGDPTWDADAAPESRRRRRVTWLNSDEPIVRADLSIGAQGKLSGQNTVSDLGLYADELSALARTGAADTEQTLAEQAVDDSTATGLVLPQPTQKLADSLYVPLPWLAEFVQMLTERKQVVLYGPPGTGKTFLAQAVADFLTDATSGETRLVQFHPSYAYEDFFEGFRPREGKTAGSIEFERVHGPLRLIAKAAEDETGPYILIIDELNRANIAKVFGELYFLLEYRQRSINLQYSPDDDFHLPENLLIIATMNTADRSIAVVDQAMRRRFDFISLFPGEPPIRNTLRAWLKDQSMPATAADILDTLNAKLGDRETAIGPSYFMHERSRTPEGLARIWRTTIIPLLEERFAGSGVDVANVYALEQFIPGPAQPETSQLPAVEMQQEPVTDGDSDAPQFPDASGS